jgi:hypothetical protein
VPDTWPGGFGAYKHSKQAVRIGIATLAVLWLIAIVLYFALDLLLKDVGGFISYLVGPLWTVATTLVFISAVRGKRLSVGEALNESVSYWLKAIGLSILTTLSIMASFVLLIVPFFFVFPRLTLAYYFLVDKNMGVMDAYKASWNATKGNVGKVYGIIGASIAMALLSITIIGIPFSVYFLVMYSAAYAVLYEYLNKKQPQTAAPAQPGPQAPPPTPAGPQAPSAPTPA